jgi:type IV pilus assembly protein PilE
MMAHSHRCDRAVNSQRGVTLIELITVMVVIAILASIAIPSYRSYLLRAQRSDGTRALLHVQAAQEKFFAQNNSYTANLAAPSPAGLGIAALSDSGFYDINVVLTNNGAGYTATATPHAGGGQTDDSKCQVFTVDHNLRKSAGDGLGNDVTRECWR